MNSVDTLWVAICAALVLLMQAGFVCFEAGLTRTKNSINVALKNITDFSLAAMIFWMFGFAFMFGESYYGIIGVRGFMPSISDFSLEEVVFFTFQVMFCGTAVTIISGAVAERLKFTGYLIVAVWVSLIIFPILGGWIWSPIDGSADGLLERYGFVDFAGGAVVHGTGAWVALALLLVLGPRHGRFPKNGKPHKLAHSNLPLAMLGVLILFVGWTGFNGGSVLAWNHTAGLVVANTVFSFCAGLLTALLISFLTKKYADAGLVMNGGLAGLVSITACANVVNLHGSILIGIIGAVLAFFAEKALIRLKIDDVVSAVPVHGVCGSWGLLAVPLLGETALLENGVNRWSLLLVQASGVVASFIWAFGLSFLFFKFVSIFFTFRVSEAQEKLGLNIAEHNASSAIVDLLSTMKKQENTKSLSLRVEVEPHTDIGEIAKSYNRVIESNQKVIQDKSNALEKLLTSKLVTQAALDASGSMIWISDIEGLVTSFSGYLKDFTVCPPRDVFGKNWAIFVQDREQDRVKEEWEVGLKAEEPFTIKCNSEKKSGEIRTHEIAIAPVRKLTGRLIGWVGTGTDITDHLSAVGELEERLKSEKLDSQQGKLESIGRLAAGIAHEINTPVQYVTDNLNFLKDSQDDILKLIAAATPSADGSLDAEGLAKLAAEVDFEFLKEEIPTAINETLEGANRISEIVLAMKDFSHPGSEEMQAVDMNKLITSTTIVSRARWKYFAELNMDLDSNLPPVKCHPGEVNQVILNLIVNAADAINENSGESKELGHIDISTSFDEDFAYIDVKDDGGGIPESVQAKIFEPFFTTKDIGKGTGQGLAICRSVIFEKHGGDLSFDVKDGGTTFKVKLPLKQIADRETQ